MAEPVLQLDDAEGGEDDPWLGRAVLRLRVDAGECVLIAVAEAARAERFADLCCGLPPPRAGSVRVLGLDWTTMGHREAAALRGRIGRMRARGAWSGRGAEHDITIASLHHTRTEAETVAETALALARRFGLPGLPTDAGAELREIDRARAAAVRAFLGEPDLLLLEQPPGGREPSVLASVFRVLSEALRRGAGAVCLVREVEPWRPFDALVGQRFQLYDSGLQPIGRSA